MAALLVRTVLLAKRQVASPREQWDFLLRPKPVAAGIAATAIAVVAIALSNSSWTNLVWALLIGLLVAFIADRIATPKF